MQHLGLKLISSKNVLNVQNQIMMMIHMWFQDFHDVQQLQIAVTQSSGL